MADSIDDRSIEWESLNNDLKVLLAEAGLTLQLGGDCYISKEYNKDNEHKILIFNDKIFNVDSVSMIMRLLSKYETNHSEHRTCHTVFLIEAHSDGTEMSPRAGIRISSLSAKNLTENEISESDRKRTHALYIALSEFLLLKGHSDPFGNGDYWIVDDGWIPLSQKVCIFNLGFLSPALVAGIQKLLKSRFSDCVVWFQLELLESGRQTPHQGMRVYADRIEHDWDREMLRREFSDRFLW